MEEDGQQSTTFALHPTMEKATTREKTTIFVREEDEEGTHITTCINQ